MSAFLDPAHQQGVLVYVHGRGLLVNGQLDDDAAERIRELGGKVVEHVWVEPVTEETWFERASDEEKRERLAADLMLGRMPNAEGVTRTERDIQASMAKALAPMRKSTHVAGVKKAPRRNW